MRKSTKEKTRESTGQQPGTKSGRRPADKPVINRGSIGYRVSPFGLHSNSIVRASEDSFRRVVRCLGGPRKHEGWLFPERTDPSASHPARPRSAPPPRRAPPCPDRGVSGFWIRQINTHYVSPIIVLECNYLVSNIASDMWNLCELNRARQNLEFVICSRL